MFCVAVIVESVTSGPRLIPSQIHLIPTHLSKQVVLVATYWPRNQSPHWWMDDGAWSCFRAGGAHISLTSRYTPDGSLLGFTRRLSPAARDRDTPRGFLFGNAGAAARWLGGPRRLALLLIHPSYSSTASYSSTYSRTNQPIPELQVHAADVSDASATASTTFSLAQVRAIAIAIRVC